jgi:hypothetical protein
MASQSNAAEVNGANTTAGDAQEQDKSGSMQPGDMMLQTTKQAQAMAGPLADQAKQQISGQLQTQKQNATGSLSSVADALRKTSQHLEEQDQAPIAGYASKAADGVERIVGYLNERDIDALRRDAEKLARTQPVAFIAGAFALGWLGARFFKSGAPSQSSGQGASSYSQSPYGTPSYGGSPYTGSPYSGDRYGSAQAGTTTTPPAQSANL